MGFKSRWNRTAALFVSLALFGALVAVPTIGMAAPVATIRGTITNSSGSSLAGIRVTLQGALGSSSWAQVVTGVGGSYSFGVPAAGAYDVTVADPNGVYLMDIRPFAAVTTGIVTSNFTMVRPGGMSGTVTSVGTTLSPAVAIQQVEVTSLRTVASYVYWDGTALTDQNGAYAITGAFPGAHTVEFTDVSGRPEPFATQSRTANVVEGGNTANVNMALLSGITLSGRVTDFVTAASMGAVISIQNTVTSDRAQLWAGPDGTYRLSGLAAGTYLVSASSATSTLSPLPDYNTATATVTLANNQILPNVNFALTRATVGSITGRVIGTPGGAALPGIEVRIATLPLHNFGNPVFFSTVTTATGTYSLPSRVGTVTITFVDPTGTHASVTTTLVAAGPAALADVALPAIGAISGVVTDAAAKPLAGASVLLWNATDTVAPIDTAMTTITGAYSFGRLPAGNYKVSFTADTYVTEYYGNAQTFSGSTTVTVGASGMVANVTLSRPHTITGMLIGSNSGLPLANTLVEAVHIGFGGPELVGAPSAITDASGGFTIGSLVSGSFVVRVGGPTGGYVFPGGQWLTSNIALAANYTFLDTTVPVTINAFAGNLFDTVAPSVTTTFAVAQRSGAFLSTPATVTITAIDVDSGVAVTNYTLDGGVTKVYTGPFAVATAGTHVVRAWATDLLGNVSPTVTQSIGIIDAVAPATAIALSAPSAPTMVTLSAVDASSGVASINYTINGGATLLYTVPFSITTTTVPTTVSYWATDKVGNVSTPSSTVIGQLVGATNYEETSTLIAYGGVWTSYANALYSGGSLKLANAAGASFTVAFNGTAIQWINSTSALYGIARVTLDGVLQPNVDLYSAVTRNRQVVFSVNGLAAGPHTLVVTWTGTKNALSANRYIGIDAIGVVGTLTAPPVTYEETNTLITRRGVWTSALAPAYSGGSLVYTNSVGTSFTVAFTGTAVDWVSSKGPNYGIAQITLDGVIQFPTVDLYNATFLNKQIAFSATGLAAGPHTLVVTRTGTKNLLSTNTVMSLDAVKIVGTLTQAAP